MRVISVPGRLIVDPASGRVIDEVGIEVSEHDPFWTRLINDGDVAVGQSGKSGKSAAKE